MELGRALSLATVTVLGAWTLARLHPWRVPVEPELGAVSGTPRRSAEGLE
jgi:hypothetical protein